MGSQSTVSVRTVNQQIRETKEREHRHVLARAQIRTFLRRVERADREKPIRLFSDLTTHIEPASPAHRVLYRAAEEVLNCARLARLPNGKPDHAAKRFGLYVAERILCIVDHVPLDHGDEGDDAQPESQASGTFAC